MYNYTGMQDVVFHTRKPRVRAGRGSGPVVCHYPSFFQNLPLKFKPHEFRYREGPPGWAEHPLRTSGFEIKLNGE